MGEAKQRIRRRCYCTNKECGKMSMLTIGGPLRKCSECGAKVRPTERSMGGLPPSGRDYAVHIRMRPEVVKVLRTVSSKRASWKRSSLTGTINALCEEAVRDVLEGPRK